MGVDVGDPQSVTQTITNGATATAPSEDAVFDALALKAPLSVAPAVFHDYAPGLYYQEQYQATAVSSQRAEAELEFAPFWLPTGTLDRLGEEQTGAGTAGAVRRLGIYRLNAAATGVDLILDITPYASDGANAWKPQTINQAVTKGLHFFGAVTQGGATRPSLRALTTIHPMVGSTTVGVNGAGYRATAAVAGALPASLLFATDLSVSGAPPKMTFRFSSIS